MKQHRTALKFIKPTHVFLNFMNYMKKGNEEFIRALSEIRRPDLVGTGRETENILSLKKYLDGLHQKL